MAMLCYRRNLTDGEYKTAVKSLEVFRQERESRFDAAYKTMQTMIEERGAKCRWCLEAYVNGERQLMDDMSKDIDRLSVVTNCIKPVGDMEQLSMSFIKDINSHPKTVVYESFRKPVPESIFGMSLQEYVDKHKHPIPLVIVKCSEAINRAGLNREGIYRVSGRHAQIMNLKRLFDSDEEGVDFTNPPFSEDCTSIAAVLKIYLRELPQPLFPFALSERITYSANPDCNTRLGELKARLKALPGCNIDTLQFLIEHLRKIYDHVETNKMTLDNLSMIFTPAIFHDFNSAMVPGATGQQGHQQDSISHSSSAAGGGTGALSFAASHASLSTSSPSSPSPNATPSNAYPFPPAAAGGAGVEQGSKSGQQQQFYPQNQNLGFNHPSGPGGGGAATGRASPMPMSAPEGSSSAHSLPLPQQNQQNQSYGASPQHSGMVVSSTSPPGGAGGGSGFTASAATTTSTAASWSNDLVLSDLILNSTSVFNVLPKLPARTNSVYSTGGSSIYSNSDDRHLSVNMSGITLTGGNVVSGIGISTARPFSNSRKSSASSLGMPSSPIDGGGQLRPRMDSLPNIAATAAAPSPPPPQQRQAILQQHQQQQQQQQHQYHQSPKQQHQQQYQPQTTYQQYQLPTPQPQQPQPQQPHQQQQYGYTGEQQRQNSPPSRRTQPAFDPQQQQQH
ncbi:hypothetical protein BGZ95_008570 [Linnemannia exigua]|uniref:Rho-GAP domain-containing protein n=1 Tax=Linnemannia exigua TaxID=604196 RepID=A0AAD4DDX0_9FUNG|nr:hypothetical protein BGZ95_008570 [Linnemannia exigua]